VGIYHTHTGETYALTDGTERLTGKRGGVVIVGEALKKELEDAYGIRVAHSTNINDVKYNTSYVESEKDARSLLHENTELEILLDIHRDAGKSRQNSLVKVQGQECAPIMFVVGSDARTPFPTWRQNYGFVKELAGMLDKQYPGLCCGVMVKEGRYNQFLHPRAILVEIGSVSNSTEEAERSARLLAGIIAGKLQDIVPDKLRHQESGAGEEQELLQQGGVKETGQENVEIHTNPGNYEDNNPE
jgi:stage II sporulation protein P